jgi:hypothetical protein
MKNTTLLFAAVTLIGYGVQAQQTTPETKPAPATYTGCVMQSPNVATVYLFAAQDRCLVLQGKYDASKSANHEVTFKGTLTEAAGNKPPSLSVDSVIAVKDACSRTCVLPPPRRRGLNQTPDPDTGASNAHPDVFPAKSPSGPPKKDSSASSHQ